ncbi:biotin--[acetyl-CoA-carboxylase] ligase [Futiania mangrovi]|uniref:biotin--[biotin carboxyl-carrier protein] ligase n=1 Tax=Futiania mangrovi TaxID=2959716 RepID=A0A9J6PBP3_9PROT|nr:biotin--[acetyl-CoA-carboxylase] ligase [Futiania mangrovii]MCP1335606.1 biotin--[acetyl-CoA-carboxylase] ligase [Futiania mangrovii]
MAASLPGRLADGTPVRAFAEVDSTMRLAREAFAAGETGPLWIVGAIQTAGRGRAGRAWSSEAGNFAGTLLLTLDAAPALLGTLSLVVAVAVAETLEEAGVPGLSLKWPNDVLAGGAKIAGILIETAGAGGPAGATRAAIGIGINLAHHPEGIAYPVTDAASETGRAPAVADVLAALSARLRARIAEWEHEGFAPARARWLALGPQAGAMLTGSGPAGPVTGSYDGLDPDGALRLATPSGIVRITAGDVIPAQET